MATLIEKFCPDMKMLSTPNYELYEIHGTGGKSLFRWKQIFGLHGRVDWPTFNLKEYLDLEKSQS